MLMDHEKWTDARERESREEKLKAVYAKECCTTLAPATISQRHCH